MLRRRKKAPVPVSSIDYLQSSNPWQLTEAERIQMTVSCKDCDHLPKVKNAGKVVKDKNGEKIQIMHNGLKVIAGGYYGDLIEQITVKLKGHHEPQEEKVFNEILKRIDSSKPVMIELGSFWAYYSIWFKSIFEQGTAICCEPDPQNIQLGIKNMSLNGFEAGDGLVFRKAAAGEHDLTSISFDLDSKPGEQLTVSIESVDGIVKRNALKNIDVLHIDVQGAELGALKGAQTAIKSGLIRFVVVSTHHYVFSGDPMTHQHCEKFLRDNGATVVAAHNVVESFSGDGLIVASFDQRDKDFKVDISSNNGRALFRPYEEDIQMLLDHVDAINKVVKG